jgi:hypothetical protein
VGEAARSEVAGDLDKEEAVGWLMGWMDGQWLG